MRGHAQVVEDKINALGASPTEAALLASKAVYNALTTDEKRMVDTAKVSDLNQKYQTMLEQKTAAEKAAAEFATQVAEVAVRPTVDKIEELETAYGRLSDDAKGKVDSGTKTDYDELVADKTAALPVIDKLSAIDLSKLTPENQAAVNDALSAYSGLTADQKALADEATDGKAGVLKGADDEVTKVIKVIDGILSHMGGGTITDGCPSQSDITPPIADDHSYEQHRKSVEEAKLAYERLSDPARKLVPESAKEKLNREYSALIAYLDYINTAATAKARWRSRAWRKT